MAARIVMQRNLGCSLNSGIAPSTFFLSSLPLLLGVELNATKHCDIMSEIATVTFEDADTTYKAGIPYTGKVTGLPV